MRVTTYKATMDADYKNTVLVREKSSNYSTLDRLDKPEQVATLMNDVFSLNIMSEEYCYIICTDNRNRVMGFFEISHGTTNSSLVSARSIYIRALLLGAVAIILVHNHPSGDSSPSSEDINVTKNIYHAGQLIDINLLDHIIVAGNDYYSFKENNLIIQ